MKVLVLGRIQTGALRVGVKSPDHYPSWEAFSGNGFGGCTHILHNAGVSFKDADAHLCSFLLFSFKFILIKSEEHIRKNGSKLECEIMFVLKTLAWYIVGQEPEPHQNDVALQHW
jgi:hypothetical protein